MNVLIPAGGQGSRLRPLTDHQPKPLLPLGDRPILSRIVQAIPQQFPITIIVTAELWPTFEAWRRDQHPQRDIQIYAEKVSTSGRRGPVAALAECISELNLKGSLLVTMGDSVLPLNFASFTQANGGKRTRIAAYELADRRDATRFGVLETGADGVLVGFEEKPSDPRSGCIFTGCCYVPERLLTAIQDIALEAPAQMGYLVQGLLRKGEVIDVEKVTGEWHDIGTFTSYLQAHRLYMSDKSTRHLVEQGNRIEGIVYVHPTATIRGSTLRNCVVLENTHITNTTLTECVVQPHIAINSRIIERKLIGRELEVSFLSGGLA